MDSVEGLDAARRALTAIRPGGSSHLACRQLWGREVAAGGPTVLASAAKKKADREAREARRRLHEKLFPSDSASVLESKRWSRPEERHDGAGSPDRAD